MLGENQYLGPHKDGVKLEQDILLMIFENREDGKYQQFFKEFRKWMGPLYPYAAEPVIPQIPYQELQEASDPRCC